MEMLFRVLINISEVNNNINTYNNNGKKIIRDTKILNKYVSTVQVIFINCTHF